MHIIRTILQFLLIALFIVLVAVISVALVAVWSLLIAWPLSHWLPISLGEGAILASIASFMAMVIWYRILDLGRSPSPASIAYTSDEDDDEFWYHEDYPISSQRFAATLSQRTGENWLRYDLANELAMAIDDSPPAKGLMNEKQIHELAIRLSDMIVALVKEKPEIAARLNIPTLKKQMNKMGLSPYDDAILQVAIRIWKEELSYPEVRDLVHQRSWDEPW